MARRRLLGVSTKLYFDIPQTEKYISAIPSLLKPYLSKNPNFDFFVIPTFLSIHACAPLLKSTRNLHIGAQDCFWEDRGAFTGEISPADLAYLGVRYVELGHAERRRMFGEDDKQVGKKAAAVIKAGMIPLVCVGEKSEFPYGDVETGADFAISEMQAQLYPLMSAIPTDAEIVLAYEPMWAIGKPEPASADHVVAVTKKLRDMVNESRKGKTSILYGGSAGPGLFMKVTEGVDGLFLGRFAHDLESLRKTVEEVALHPSA